MFFLGVITDTVSVTALLHSYGALAFWDFATGGPYLDIDMHPHCNKKADKDAVFLSMHKFLGGVDAPGETIFYTLCLFEIPPCYYYVFFVNWQCRARIQFSLESFCCICV